MKAYKQPYKIMQRLIALCGCGNIAKACGKTTETVDAWGRPPESNEDPHGTGKRGPLDCVLRLQRLAHREGDDALVSEIAEIFADNAADLCGVVVCRTADSRDVLIGSAVKEHSEAIVECLKGDHPDFEKAYQEIVEAEVALGRLKQWVKEELADV